MSDQNFNQSSLGLNITSDNGRDNYSSYAIESRDNYSTTYKKSATTSLSYFGNSGGKLISSGGTKPCPICSGTSSCSFKADYSLVLCHRETSDTVSKFGKTWKFRGYADKGRDTTWAIYGELGDYQVNFDSQIKQNTGYVKPAQESASKNGSTLTSEIRDANYRKIAGMYQKLHTMYNVQLLGKREVKQEEIDFLVKECALFNWENQINVSALKLPLDLPGVNATLQGTKLCGSEGFFVSAFNLKGQIVGGQIAARDRTKGKYKPVSSNKFSGKSWHLEGEWPLAYWDFTDKFDMYRGHQTRNNLKGTLFVTEGFLKPLVLGVKLIRHHKNFRVVGASGGQFHQSYRQLKAIMNQGYSRVVLCADKTCLENKSVIDKYYKVRKTLANWGFKVDVMFYSHADCDELKDFEYINAPNQVMSWGKFERLISPAVSSSVQQNNESSLAKRKKEYLAKKVLNRVDFQTDTQYLDIPVPKEGEILMIKSPLGTGKTTYLDRVLNAYKYGWLLIGYRNNLLIETCHNRSKNGVSFNHLHEDQMYQQMADPHANIAFCVDSLPNWSIERLEGRPLIIDECKSVMNHILTSTTRVKDDRINNLEKFKEAIRMSPMVILMDATADEVTLKFYQELAGGRKIIVHENKASQKEKFTVVLSSGVNGKGEESNSDKSHLIRQILENEGNIAVFSDSRRECEAIAALEEKRGRKVFLLTSETVVDDDVKKALKNLNQFILDNGIQTLIYSPSGESGIDVNLRDYFTAVYGLFYGVISIDSCMQMIGRVRDTKVPRYLSVPKCGIGENEDIFSITIKNKMIENMILDAAYTFEESAIKECVQAVLQESIGQTIHWSFKYITSFKADSNLERQCFRELFVARLQQLGMTIHRQVKGNDDEVKGLMKGEKEEAKKLEAQEIFNIQDIDKDEYEYLSKKYSLNLSEQRKLIKYKLKMRLPGIEQTQLWSPEFIKDILIDNPSKISQIERLIDIDMPLMAIEKGKERWSNYLNREKLSIADTRHDTAILKTLEKLDILPLLENGKTYSEGDEELETFMKKCTKEVQRVLGLKIGKQNSVRFFGRVISKFFGLKLSSFRPRVNGKQTYVYMISGYEDSYLNIMCDCIMRRYEKVMDRTAKMPEPLAVQRIRLSQETRAHLDNTPSPNSL